MLMPLVYRCVIPFYYRRYKRFIANAGKAREKQRQVLLEKIRRNADSDFGREHGFSKIQSVEDFRRHVPISNYEHYRPYIERVKKGDETAMFAAGTKILMFALTSGTTDKSKFIPVTQEFFNEYRQSWLTWGGRNFGQHTDQVWKKALQLSTNWQQLYTEAGIPCGSISGLTAELSPKVTRFAFSVPLPVIKIKNAASKHYTALRISMASPNVGMVITANPSTLIEFARRADNQRESLIRDIHDGTLAEEIDVDSAIRQALSRYTSRRDPPRARELERLALQHGTLYPKVFWPQLSLIAVWMGGSVGVYLPRLKEFYGDTALRDHGLTASEGRMTIPIEDGTSTGVLDYLSHFYEFIPEGEIDSNTPTVLEAHELEVDKNYFILLSTSSGLYRYDIHDVVKCVGYEGQVPLLNFLNKGANFSSITGEKLSEFQVVLAATRSFEELELPVESFTIAPIMKGDHPGYVILIEPSTTGRNNEDFARRVESHLKTLNMEYADKLESGRLRPLSVQEIPSGTWHSYRIMRTSERGNFEEYKHPCLANDVNFVDKLTGLMANQASK